MATFWGVCVGLGKVVFRCFLYVSGVVVAKPRAAAAAAAAAGPVARFNDEAPSRPRRKSGRLRAPNLRPTEVRISALPPFDDVDNIERHLVPCRSVTATFLVSIFEQKKTNVERRSEAAACVQSSCTCIRRP